MFMIFLQNLAFSNLHNLYICYIDIVYLLYKDHTVFVWHYHNFENPYPPQQGDSNLGRVGGHQWGQSWRDRPPPPAARPQGVLAGPGTPRDPKSHLFATKWVAIQPFWTFLAAKYAEFRPGSRRGGPGA